MGGVARRSRCAARIATVFVFLLPPTIPLARASDEGPLGLADLPAYRAALRGRSEHTEAPVAVTFRELWDSPDKYQGRRVRVSGAIVRRFRQGAYGDFPPLDEVWIVSAAGNPLCLVSPAQAPPVGKLGDTVQFVGTYLKRVQYQGGDVPRLAPLIVGEHAPSLLASAKAPAARPRSGLSALDWIVGIAAAGLVVIVLGHRHLRRPLPSRWDAEVPAPPEFVRPGFEENGSAV